ncbi:hypothetical protein [Pseudomonas sp. TMB3-21]
MSSLIHGWGINDAGYTVQVSKTTRVNGARKVNYLFECPFYKRWADMLRRSISAQHKAVHPSYLHVTVSDEWQRFSTFREWMQAMPWQGNELDKDILGDGSHYSPETCCFIPKAVNLFFTRCKPKSVGLVGASFDKASGKFKSQCKIGDVRQSLGYFETEAAAHAAWLNAKAQSLDILLGRYELDTKIVEALRAKIHPDNFCQQR